MSFRLVPKSVTLNDLDLLGRGSWIPIKYNVTWLRPTSLPSGILIHVAVWPQQTWAKNWGLCPVGEWELDPHVTQCGQCPSLPP